jgi:hypothetical protein
MSMAFAAALAGGVALEREDVERDTHESQAVRNLRGNLRLFGAFGPGAGGVGAGASKETTEADQAASESRLVRHHTEASIFIALHDELRRTGRVGDDADASALQTGDIVSLTVGPAVAPLRRIVDQFIRLIDVGAPLLGLGEETAGDRRPSGHKAAKRASAESPDVAPLRALRSLLVALQDDLDRSGMLDVVVAREDGPSVILTLDKRFVSDQSLELLHTSRFTVIGKVTQVWAESTDFVNLYRRSVISLVPALGQTVTWGMLALLSTLARSLDPAAAERAAYAAAGLTPGGDSPSAAAQSADRPGPTDDVEAEEAGDGTDGDGPDESAEDEIMLGPEAIQALNPAVGGPAIQILPLAICA